MLHNVGLLLSTNKFQANSQKKSNQTVRQRRMEDNPSGAELADDGDFSSSTARLFCWIHI